MEKEIDYTRLTDDEIKKLLSQGIRFKHHTLEEYAEITGRPIIGSEEIDFGTPQGNEIW